MLKLKLNQDPQGLVPGQIISGKAGWQGSSPPRRASLRLFWYTEGRGTQDIGIVEEQDVHVHSSSHDFEFSFQLPPEPISFEGQLIALHWALELVRQRKAGGTQGAGGVPLGRSTQA